MGWFRRKPKPDHTPVEEHQRALSKFLRNETSLGMYGSVDDINRARSAMRYFASMAALTTEESEEQ